MSREYERRKDYGFVTNSKIRYKGEDSKYNPKVHMQRVDEQVVM